MLSEIVFGVSAAVAIFAALFMFKAKEMTHAMTAFLVVATAGAAILAVLGLPLLALLQLFIMVGGVSTYLFVGVSSENLSRFKHTSISALAILVVALLAVPVYKIYSLASTANQGNVLSNSAIKASVAANLPLFYMIAILMFGIGIGSIIMMRTLKQGAIR